MLTSLIYALLIPAQFNVTLAGIYLSPFRIFLMGAALFLTARGLRGSLRFTLPDLLVVLAAAWIWLASYMTSGSALTSMVQGGAHTVDMALAYFLARVCIQTPRDFRMLLILISPGIAFISAIIVAESVTHVRILQPLASSLTGAPNPLRDDIRLGLMRGAASFPHPILAGIFLASFLPLFLMSGIRGWPKYLGVGASFGGIFTMSSAALLGVLAGAFLRAYDWLAEQIINLTWRVFLAVAAIVYVLVELTSNTGTYGLLVRYASLNTVSAYNRVLIWQYGTENIANNPWFGIGYANWDRPSWMRSDSFDHFWLIMALRFGLPEAILLISATLIGIITVALNSRNMAPDDARLMRGVAISLAIFALGVNSVSLWLSALVWFFVLLGIAVSLGGVVIRPIRTEAKLS
nr:O-antigen ligase family protein [Erythrobacter crassostrea]